MIALAFCLCVFRLHQSNGRRGCSGRLVVASLEETWGLLSRFDCVYSGYITQGSAGVLWWVAMSLRARCFFFPTHEAGILGRFLAPGPQPMLQRRAT